MLTLMHFDFVSVQEYSSTCHVLRMADLQSNWNDMLLSTILDV